MNGSSNVLDNKKRNDDLKSFTDKDDPRLTLAPKGYWSHTKPQGGVKPTLQENSCYDSFQALFFLFSTLQ